MSEAAPYRRAPGRLCVWTAAAGLSIALFTIAAPAANACLCKQLEDWGFLAPQTGRLPVNAAGVARYMPGESLSGEEILAQVSVEAKQDGVFQEVPATARGVPGFPGIFAIGPKGGLKAGATYRFTDRRD